MVKKILLWISLVSAGAGASLFLRQNNSIELEKLRSDQLKYQELKEKFEVFSSTDLEEYTQLKKTKDQFTKADELLGKMILIFLADVGVRTSSHQSQFAKNALTHDTTQMDRTRLGSTDKSSLDHPSQKHSVRAAPAAWTAPEVKLKTIKEDPEISTFLSETRIPDLGRRLGDASRIKKVDPQYVGCFDGPVIFNSKSDKTWRVRINVHSNDDPATNNKSKPLAGKVYIQLIKNGKVIDHPNIKSQLESFRQFADESNALLLEASDSIYFQLYFVSDRDLFAGNMYKKSGFSKFDFRGTVTLNRTVDCPS